MYRRLVIALLHDADLYMVNLDDSTKCSLQINLLHFQSVVTKAESGRPTDFRHLHRTCTSPPHQFGLLKGRRRSTKTHSNASTIYHLRHSALGHLCLSSVWHRQGPISYALPLVPNPQARFAIIRCQF